MNYLLENAVAAHGGLDRWNQVKSITVDASITRRSPQSRPAVKRGGGAIPCPMPASYQG
jgi:hypothetical protein